MRRLLVLVFLLSSCTPPVELTSTTDVTPSPKVVSPTLDPVGKSEPMIVDTQSPVTITKEIDIDPTQTAQPRVDFQFCSPLVDHTIDSLFNIVSSPFDPPPIGKDDRHQGVDFAYYQQAGRESIAGEGVASILSGRVSMAIAERLPYGNMVMIETKGNGLYREMITELGLKPGESLYHLYAHLLQEPEPKLGDWVNCGEMLGFVGATGYNVPVAHLHLETRIGPENASWQTMAYYDTRATEVEMETYELWRLSGEFRAIDPMSLFSFSFNLSNGRD